MATMAPTDINDTGVPFVYPGEILGAAIVLPALGIILIALRFYVREAHGSGIQADDWAILAALVRLQYPCCSQEF